MKGMVLTERDLALLGYLAVARYVTAAQAHRLLAPGHDKAITSRRLARLCELGSHPGDGAYLRRIAYHRSNALPFPVWALTPHGRAVAEPAAPGPVATTQAAVGIQFVERILALNEVLLALVLAARRSEAAPLTDLPFRWRVADEPLRFEVLDRDRGWGVRPAVLRPGAVIDIPGCRRRVFLEPEVGSTSLAPSDPREGHVKHRLERYTTFFLSFPGRDMRRTWYGAAFPDAFYPEVLVLARTEARRAVIDRHIKDWFRGGEDRFALRALTLAGATAALAPLVAPPAGVVPQASTGRASRTLVIDDDLNRRIVDGLEACIHAINVLRRQSSAHAETCPNRFRPEPIPVAAITAFRDLVAYDVLGRRRAPTKDREP